MPKFNKKEFGENLKRARKSKGLTQENMGKVIGKNATTIGRFESGRLVPNAEEISLMCNELNINEYELFNTTAKIHNIEKSINPFKVKTLYLYYRAFFTNTKKYGKGKFKLEIIEKPDRCEVSFMDYKTNKIYLAGYMLADDNIAVFVFENYKPNNPRLEVSEIILNIAGGLNGLMLGTFYCTNGQYVPSIRKCIISKEDVEYDDNIEELLKINDESKKELEAENVIHIELDSIDDFEANSEE